jgi:hypothetical protein
LVRWTAEVPIPIEAVLQTSTNRPRSRVWLLLLLSATIFAALPVHAAVAAPPAVTVHGSPTIGAAPLTTTLTASGDAVTYRWELPGGANAVGPQVTSTFAAGRWVVAVIGTSATGEETRATVTVTSVAISVSAPRVATYRARAFLTGRIIPALPGSRLTVQRDGHAAGNGLARTGGRFRIGIRPRVPGSYTVSFGGAVSNPAPVTVRPLVAVELAGPPVVGARLTAAAKVKPSSAGRLSVSAYRGGRLVARRTGTGAVRLALSTVHPRAYRVVATIEPRAGFTRRSALLDATIRVPNLVPGSAGGSVLELDRRLTALGFALEGVTVSFGYDDYEAVLAFQKLYGLPRTGRVDARFWAVLDGAQRPKARYGGDHIEVDKTRQVLFLVRDGRVVLISSVSTGATGNTPNGRFQVYRKVTGWDWVLWYPMYFLRGFAIHGYPDVPGFTRLRANPDVARAEAVLAERLRHDDLRLLAKRGFLGGRLARLVRWTAVATMRIEAELRTSTNQTRLRVWPYSSSSTANSSGVTFSRNCRKSLTISSSLTSSPSNSMADSSITRSAAKIGASARTASAMASDGRESISISEPFCWTVIEA